MKVDKMAGMVGGWFTGNFAPAAFQSRQFEVCHKKHPKGDKWPRHYHAQAVEINALLSGRMRILGQELVAGDIFTIYPFEVAEPEFLEDCELIIVKAPSVPGDKIILGPDDPDPKTSYKPKEIRDASMRTAVVMSGLPREVDECWRSQLNNLLKQLPRPDVFIYSGQHYTVSPEFFQEIAPKKYKVEPQWHHWHAEQALKKVPYYDNGHLNNYCQQIYGMYKAWELKKHYEDETGVKYDLAVRTRPDFVWLRPLSLDWLELDKISNLHANFSPTMATEFAIGPDDMMDQFFQIYEWIKAGGASAVCTPGNPIFAYAKQWNSDAIQLAYLRDHLHFPWGTNERIPMDYHSPFDYYRIMGRHKKGEYDPAPVAK